MSSNKKTEPKLISEIIKETEIYKKLQEHKKSQTKEKTKDNKSK